jgi:hypothetical protein
VSHGQKVCLDLPPGWLAIIEGGPFCLLCRMPTTEINFVKGKFIYEVVKCVEIRRNVTNLFPRGERLWLFMG